MFVKADFRQRGRNREARMYPSGSDSAIVDFHIYPLPPWFAVAGISR
jgi:hypothetical protein